MSSKTFLRPRTFSRIPTLQGHREEGAGGYNDPGAHGPYARKGPIKISLKTFFFHFFGDHLILTEKTVRISVKNLFFFEDHIIIWTKLRHCLRLFCSSQNRKSVIFELAPGPRSALGAPAPLVLSFFHSTVSLSHKKFLFLKISDDVIVCDLQFGPPLNQNPCYAYGIREVLRSIHFDFCYGNEERRCVVLLHNIAMPFAKIFDFCSKNNCR